MLFYYFIHCANTVLNSLFHVIIRNQSKMKVDLIRQLLSLCHNKDDKIT